MAARYGTDHEEFDVNPESGLADAIEQFAYYFDEPNADGGALPVWFLSRLTRQQRHGGAERRGGGRAIRRLPDLSRRPTGAARAAAARLAVAGDAGRRCGGWPVSDEKIGFEYMLKRFLEGCLMPAGRAHVYWNGTFSDAEKAALIGRAAAAGARRDAAGAFPGGRRM